MCVCVWKIYIFLLTPRILLDWTRDTKNCSNCGEREFIVVDHMLIC